MGDEKSVPLSIHQAIARKDRSAVSRALFSSPEALLSRDDEQRTPICVAAAMGDVSILAALLRRAASLNSASRPFDLPDGSGLTPLHWAAMEQKCEALQLLLQHGADAEAQDEDGRTALHTVAFGANPQCLSLLIPHISCEGINTPSFDGLTPLHYAALGGSVPCVTMLLEARAAVDAVDEDGRTPLSWAASESHDGVLISLLRARADASAVDKNAMTPLHHAAKSATLACVQLLLRGGSNALKRTVGGMLPEEMARARAGQVGLEIAATLRSASESEAMRLQEVILAEERLAKTDTTLIVATPPASARSNTAVRRRKKEARKQIARIHRQKANGGTDDASDASEEATDETSARSRNSGSAYPQAAKASSPPSEPLARPVTIRSDKVSVARLTGSPTRLKGPDTTPRPHGGASAQQRPPAGPRGVQSARLSTAAASPTRLQNSPASSSIRPRESNLPPLPQLSGGGFSNGAHARALERIGHLLSPRATVHCRLHPGTSASSPERRLPPVCASPTASLTPAGSSLRAQSKVRATQSAENTTGQSIHLSSVFGRPQSVLMEESRLLATPPGQRAAAHLGGSWKEFPVAKVHDAQTVAGPSDRGRSGLDESELRALDSTTMARWLSGTTSEQRQAFLQLMQHLRRGDAVAAAATAAAAAAATASDAPRYSNAILSVRDVAAIPRAPDQTGMPHNAPATSLEAVVGRIRFDRSDVLGRGSTGTMVYIGSYMGKRAAIKVVAPLDSDSSMGFGTVSDHEPADCKPDRARIATREVELLNMCENEHSHPNVLRLFGWEEDVSSNIVYLALEMCAASLDDLVRDSMQPAQCSSRRRALLAKVGLLPPPLSQISLPPQLRRIFGEMLSAIAHLHRLGILHCKLRPRSVLVNSNGVLKLSGLGLGRLVQSGFVPMRADSRQGARDAIASEGFDPPEVIQSLQITGCTDSQPSFSPELKHSVDAFAAAVLLFWMLTGARHPFSDDATRRTANIISGEPMQLALIHPFPEARDLIAAMLRADPRERLRAHQAIEHPCLWPDERKLWFIRCVADEPSLVESCAFSQELEQLAPAIFSDGDWTSRLHAELVEALQAHRSYRKDSVRDLLRAIRNSDHMQGMSEQVQRLLLPRPLGIALYFLPRFPSLFWTLYTLVRHHWREKSVFEPFFEWETLALHQREGSGLSIGSAGGLRLPPA